MIIPTRVAPSRPSLMAAPDVWVVSEDRPGEWRVADRANDAVHGPYPDQAAATRVALEGVRRSRAWSIHVVDQSGAETGHLSGPGATWP